MPKFIVRDCNNEFVRVFTAVDFHKAVEIFKAQYGNESGCYLTVVPEAPMFINDDWLNDPNYVGSKHHY